MGCPGDALRGSTTATCPWSERPEHRTTATDSGRRRPHWTGLVVPALVSLSAPTLVLDAPEVVSNHLADHSLSEQRSLLGRVSVVHSPVDPCPLDLLQEITEPLVRPHRRRQAGDVAVGSEVEVVRPEECLKRVHRGAG